MEAHTKLPVISAVFFELQNKYCDIFIEYNARRYLLHTTYCKVAVMSTRLRAIKIDMWRFSENYG